jgi:hypothetical protein
MRLLLALLTVAVGALALACGDDDSPSASPSDATSFSPAPTTDEAAPTQTSATGDAVDCAADDLAGTLVRVGAAAGTSYYELGLTNGGDGPCTLPGKPAIKFLDAAGDPLDIVVDPHGAACEPDDLDPTVCVNDVPLELAPGAPTPTIGTPGQITVTVAIANAANFDPLPTPTFEAHAFVIKFPGIDGVVISLEEPLTLITDGQVRLHGYGASP